MENLAAQTKEIEKQMPNGARHLFEKIAVKYAARGWQVFPIAPRGKTPLTAHGLKDASTDEKQLADWWNRWPSANVAIATGGVSGFFVLDVDGKDGNESLATLEREHGPLPTTVEAKTGGGRHLFFLHPGGTVKNSAGRLGPGLDVRGDGGYIVAPPSIHPSGEQYKWRAGHAPDDLAIAEAPASLLARLRIGADEPQAGRPVNRSATYAETVLARELAALARAPEGQRNDSLNKAAFAVGKYLTVGAVDRGLAERALLAQAVEIGLTSREAEATITSGLKAGAEETRAGLAALKEKFGIEVKPKTNGDGSRALPPEAMTVSADDGAVQALAQLSPLDYDRVREKEAKKLGIRLSTLDAEVEARRPKSEGADSAPSGSAILFADPKPWPAPVDGAELLGDVCASLERFVIFPAGGVEAITLWILHAHAHDAFQISPILPLTSPEVRSGKTTTLYLLSGLVPRPLPAANISAASLFRAVETYRPTLLVDELDTFLADNEELRGILNSGHLRPLAQVVRTVGEDHEARIFSTWAPKAVAKIGRLPATLADRSIEIQMHRKKPEERVEELRLDRLHELEPLRRRAWRWAKDNLEALRRADPDMPGGLHDRQRDNWRPLLAIADLAGGEWPQKARQAALLFCQGAPGEDASFGTQLLADLCELFSEREVDRLTSAEIVDTLTTREDRPWPEYKRGKPLSKRQLARLLSRYGIQPRRVRVGQETPRGYILEDFGEAFARYLPIPPSQSATAPQPAKTKAKTLFSSATNPMAVADEK